MPVALAAASRPAAAPAPDLDAATADVAVLRIDVLDTPRALARLTSIMALRQAEVVTMEVSAPADGTRRVTVEGAGADDLRIQQLVKFLNRCADVLKVARVLDHRAHQRRAAFVKLGTAPEELGTVVGIATALGAEVVEADEIGCTLFIAAEPTRVSALLRAVDAFGVREVVTGAPLRTATSAHAGQTPRLRARKAHQR
jgi:acetolactate synthase-1/3 small subunit